MAWHTVSSHSRQAEDTQEDGWYQRGTSLFLCMEYTNCWVVDVMKMFQPDNT